MAALRVVLVEGVSDRRAIETLAARRGLDLAAEAVVVRSIGGAHAIGRVLAELVRDGVRVAGLYDAGEERAVARGLETAGLASSPTRADLERLGFFACDSDLEDELLRAVGPAGVERVLARQGDLASFRRFQNQPAQRDRPVLAQLHRFMGTRGGRKEEYAGLLVEALELDRVPRPLHAVLAHIRG